MRQVVVEGVRPLRIARTGDEPTEPGWQPVDGGGARASLQPLLDDPLALGAARALLSSISWLRPLRAPSDDEVLDGLAEAIDRGVCRLFELPPVSRGGGDRRAPVPSAPPPGRSAPAPEQKKKDPKVLTAKWEAAEAWCGDEAGLSGTTQDYDDGAEIQVEVKSKASGKSVASFQAKVSGNAFSRSWKMKDVLPEKSGGKLVKQMELELTAGGVQAPAPLKAHFVPDAARQAYASGRSHFGLAADQHQAVLEAELQFVPGWGAEVVQLGASVPGGTGGVIAGLTWPGYRWMRQVALGKQYWNGAAWVALPAGFALADSNHFCVGFYKSGAAFTCQYGGTWPGAFADWDVNAAPNKAKLDQWVANIEGTWGGKLDLRRKGCESTAPACCRYKVKVKAKFEKKDAFADGLIIVAAGNIRSNDQLWFLGEPRVAVAAHEFGHHLGNGDEYAGAASVDPTLNEDGAVNGICADSIMGQNLTTVKKRHFRTVCSHLATVVQAESGKSNTYEAVPP